MIPTGFETKLMTRELLPHVARIEADNFSEPWSYDSLEETLDDDKYRFYCLVDGKHHRVAAYVGVNAVCGEGQIVSVATDECYRRNGLGNRVLLEAILREKERGTIKLFLEVRESNLPAIGLYEKNGFIKDGVRKNFYRKPTEDAWLMSREI